MEPIASLKNTCDDFVVEFEIEPIVDISDIKDERQKRIVNGLASVDEQLLD